MTEWKEKRKGIDPPTTGYSQQGAKDGLPQATSPPGPGEWDEGLGVPLCVVCHNAENIETLEKDYGWEEGEFDFIAQWMRTVLLKRISLRIRDRPFTDLSIRWRLPNLHHKFRPKRRAASHQVITGHTFPAQPRNCQV